MRAPADQHLADPDLLGDLAERPDAADGDEPSVLSQMKQQPGAIAEVARHCLDAGIGQPGDLQAEVVLIGPEPRHGLIFRIGAE